MWRARSAQLIGAAALLWSHSSVADEITLTLHGARDLAREHGPSLIPARGQIEEARGRRAGAAILLRDNPEVDMLAGSRRSDAASSTDLEVGVGQVLELGGRRGSRIRSAEAAIVRETWAAEDTLRLLLRDVTMAFYRLLIAEERLKLARSGEAIAGDLEKTAERRRQAGDIADLELNLARVAASRARGEVKQAEAVRARASGELKALVGLRAEDAVQVRGDFRIRRTYRLAELLSTATQRPDGQALVAEERQADADLDLGSGLRWPEVGLRAEYHREGEEQVVLGGVTLRFPFFERGQEVRQTASARKRRVAAQQAALRKVVRIEVEAGFEAYGKLAGAVEEYEKNVIVLLDDNDALARKSFEGGQIGVADYLLVRREILEARKSYLDQLLELALASAELEASAGLLR